MRKSGLSIASLTLVIGTSVALAFRPGPDPLATRPVQEKKEEKSEEESEDKEEAKKDDEKKSDDAEKKEEEPKEPATPTADAVRKLVKTYDESMRKFFAATREEGFMAKYRAAEDKRAFLKNAGQPDRAQYMKEMQDIAAHSMAWLAANRRGTESQELMDVLYSRHIDSPAMELVVSMTRDSKRLRKLLKSPHERVKGLATIQLADMLMGEEPEDVEEVEALYQEVVDKYASIETSRGTIGERAKSSLFELQYLRVGKVAPDIVGKDLDGVEFKLTDYRGKVVMLDFWGNW